MGPRLVLGLPPALDADLGLQRRGGRSIAPFLSQRATEVLDGALVPQTLTSRTVRLLLLHHPCKPIAFVPQLAKCAVHDKSPELQTLSR